MFFEMYLEREYEIGFWRSASENGFFFLISWHSKKYKKNKNSLNKYKITEHNLTKAGKIGIDIFFTQSLNASLASFLKTYGNFTCSNGLNLLFYAYLMHYFYVLLT